MCSLTIECVPCVHAPHRTWTPPYFVSAEHVYVHYIPPMYMYTTWACICTLYTPPAPISLSFQWATNTWLAIAKPLRVASRIVSLFLYLSIPLSLFTALIVSLSLYLSVPLLSLFSLSLYPSIVSLLSISLSLYSSISLHHSGDKHLAPRGWGGRVIEAIGPINDMYILLTPPSHLL